MSERHVVSTYISNKDAQNVNRLSMSMESSNRGAANKNCRMIPCCIMQQIGDAMHHAETTTTGCFCTVLDVIDISPTGDESDSGKRGR